MKHNYQKLKENEANLKSPFREAHPKGLAAPKKLNYAPPGTKPAGRLKPTRIVKPKGVK